MLERLTEFLVSLLSRLPNGDRGAEQLVEALFATLEMTAIAGSIAFVLGTTFGVLLVVTKKGGILEQVFSYHLLDKVINVIRSIPFLILMILLIPLSRAIVGTGIGTTGAIIPLVFGTTPFFARQIETAIAEIDSGLVEASLAMGLSPIQIIFSVYLRESIPSIVRVTQITAINLVALTTMAGAIGAGGLGDFAIRFGHQLGLSDLLWATIVVILIIVIVIQGLGNIIIRYTSR